MERRSVATIARLNQRSTVASVAAAIRLRKDGVTAPNRSARRHKECLGLTFGTELLLPLLNVSRETGLHGLYLQQVVRDRDSTRREPLANQLSEQSWQVPRMGRVRNGTGWPS